MAKPAIHIIRWGMTALLLMLSALLKAQDTLAVNRPLPWNETEVGSEKPASDNEKNGIDSTKATISIGSETQNGNANSVFDDNGKNLAKKKNKPAAEQGIWLPKPKKALWYAIALPGAGQIYNKKYWKLPIIYGGFLGCFYAYRWNNMMYNDYSKAYLDIMDDDPDTDSYNQFLHLGNKVTPENQEQYKNLFKKRKDYYRRYRDMSVITFVAVYALSVIDAYVDASLADFDISKDLSLRVEPAIMGWENGRLMADRAAVGLQCRLTF